MQDSHLSSTEARSHGSRTPNEMLEARVYPSSSRMLTNYLADVEQNLDEHRWELAMRDVVDLPRIAGALAWSSRPRSITAMRSAIAMASLWSCVT